MRRIRTLVLSGASAGVGQALVRRFARNGVRIGLITRGRGRLDEAAREVAHAGTVDVWVGWRLIEERR